MKKSAFIILAALMTTSSHASASEVVDCSYVQNEIAHGISRYRYYQERIMSNELSAALIVKNAEYQREDAVVRNMLANVYSALCK